MEFILLITIMILVIWLIILTLHVYYQSKTIGQYTVLLQSLSECIEKLSDNQKTINTNVHKLASMLAQVANIDVDENLLFKEKNDQKEMESVEGSF